MEETETITKIPRLADQNYQKTEQIWLAQEKN